MSSWARVALAAVSIWLLTPAIEAQEFRFIRGDCDSNSLLQLSDVITDLGYLFQNQPVDCEAACDVDGNGTPSINDVIFLLSYLFVDGPDPSAPFPNCGTETVASGLDCSGPTVCGPVDSPPVIQTDAPTAAVENVTYTYTPVVNDDDPATLQFFLDLAPPGATIDPVTGIVEWTPADDQNGSFDFVLRVADGGGLEDFELFTVNVAGFPDAPVIVSVPTLTAVENDPYTYQVDATDVDPGEVLTYTLTSSPLGMTIDATTGLVSWPVPSLAGSPYTVTIVVMGLDMLTTSQTYSLTVVNANDAPTFTSAPPTTATELVPLTYTATATDVDAGDALTFSLVTAPSGATFDAVTGVLTWTPTPSQTGSNSFTLRVTDLVGAFDEQIFTIDVANIDNPITITSAPVTFGSEGQLYVYDVDGSDIDPEDTITYALPVAPLGATIDPSTGQIEWTPTFNQQGLSAFTVIATSTGTVFPTDMQSFQVDVANVNQAPTFTSVAPTAGTELQPLTYTAAATDLDLPLGDALSFSIVSGPSASAIDPATGLFSWTPSPSETGLQALTLRVVDLEGEFEDQSFTIDVANIDNAVEITSMPAALTGSEGQPYVYDVDATDIDPEDTISYALSVAPSGATIDSTTGEILWTPSFDQQGLNDFTVAAMSTGVDFPADMQSFQVDVTNVNQPPAFTSVAPTTGTELQLFSYGATASDVDLTEGDVLTFSIITGPSASAIDPATGLFTWTPSPAETGLQPVTLRVSDLAGEFEDQSFTIDVANIDNPVEITTSPAATTGSEGQPYVYDVDASDIDPEDTISYALSVAPTGAIIDSTTGEIQWTPSFDQQGLNDFTVVALSTGVDFPSDFQSFQIDVTNVNQPPTFTSTAPTTGTELQLFSYGATASDVDLTEGDVLSFSIMTGPATSSIDPATGLFTWTPSPAETGLQPVTLRVIDLEGEFEDQSFTIDVANIDNPVEITTSPAATTGSEGQPYVYDVDASDIDPEDTISYALSVAPTGAIIDSTTGEIQWTPSFDQQGLNDFTVAAMSTGVDFPSDMQSFQVDVTNVNQPPAFTSVAPTTGTELQLFSYGATASDVDLTEGDVLSFSIMTGPATSSIDPATGLFTWTPSPAETGLQPVTLRVSDLAGEFEDQSFTIDVANIDNPILITTMPAALNGTEGQPYSYDVDASDIDPEDTISYALSVAPTGAIIDSTTGEIQWTPSFDQQGLNDFTVVALSTGVDFPSDFQSFQIDVTNVNQSPMFTSAAPTMGSELQLLSYSATASDIDVASGDLLTFSIVNGPPTSSIDAVSGLFTWTPSPAETGLQPVTLRVTDLDGEFDDQSFMIDVANVDNPVVILSTPALIGAEGAPYVYDVDASDIDPEDTISYALSVAPAGAMIDATTGEILWTPGFDQQGLNDFTVVALSTGADFPSDSQSFQVDVTNVNQPPTFTSTAPTTGTELQLFSYGATASDVDLTEGDVLTFSIITGPSASAIDPATGLFTWTPSPSETGLQPVTLRVTDLEGEFDEQSFTIDVANVDNPVEITSMPASLSGTEGQPYAYDVDASDIDPEDTISYALSVAPTGAMIDATTGEILWTPGFDQQGLNDFTVVAMSTGADFPSDSQSFQIDITNVNQPPTFTSTAPTTGTELQLFSYGATASDVDLTEGDVLTFSIIIGPSASAIDPATGLFTWTPSPSETGPQPVTLRVTDLDGVFDEQSFTIDVANVDNPVEITSMPAALSGTEGQPYAYDVDASDIDPEDTISYALSVAPAGAMIDATTGEILWTPGFDQQGLNDFTVVAMSTGADFPSDSQSFQIDITNVNQAPEFTSVAPTTGTELELFSYGATASDIDLTEGDALSFSIIAGPTTSAIDSSTGLFTWTPSPSETGLQPVTLRVTDLDGEFEDQSFAIEVANVDNPVEITSMPASLSGTEGQPYAYDVDASDIDPEDTISYALSVAPTGAMIDATTGEILWTPGFDQQGLNDFTVVAMSTGADFPSDSQSFQIDITNVNQPPTFTSTAPTTGTELQLFSYGATASDVDLTEGDVLSFSIISGPASSAIDPATGLFTWTPSPSETGPQPVTLRVTDLDGEFDEQSFTIDVANVDNPVEITSMPAALSGTEGQPYAYDVDASDIDPEDTISYALSVAPAGAMIDATTGEILWTPGFDQQGLNDFTVVAMSTGADFPSDSQSFQIDITNVNQPPTFTSTAPTTGTELQLFSYGATASDIDLTEGDALSFSIIIGPSASAIDPATGLFTWTPSPSETGPQPVTLRVTDLDGEFDEQSFTIDVANVDNPVEITSMPAALSGTEGQPYAYDVDASDIDPEDTISYALSVAPAGAMIDATTGEILWTPGFDQQGLNDFTVVAMSTGADFPSDSQSFQVDITNVNQAPEFTSVAPTTGTELELFSYGATASDIDLTEGDALSFSIIAGPTTSAIDSSTGLFTWTPSPSETGLQPVTLRVTDLDGEFDEQSFTIDVANVDNPVEITSMPASLTGTEDQPYAYDVDASDIDPEDTISYALSVAPAGAMIDATTGQILWTPGFEQQGLNDFTVVAMSTGADFPSDSQSFQVDITNVNQPPTFTSTAPTTGTELQLFSYGATAIDADLAEGDVLSFSIITGPPSSAIDPATGLLTWTPSPSETGLQPVTLRVTDLEGEFDEQSFTIDVANVDNPVEITSMPASLSGTEGQPYAYDVDASDIDPEDAISYALSVAPTGAMIDATTGEILWTPGFDQAGLNDFTVVASSTGPDFPTDSQSFQIDVIDTNQFPEFSSTPLLTGGQNELYTYDVDATDGDGETVTYSLQTAPIGAEIDTMTGVINWLPDASQLGANAFTVLASDTNARSTPQDFSVVIVQNLTNILRLNAGGSDFVDVAGDLWVADDFFSGGMPEMASAPLPDISGTDDDLLYLEQRVGSVGETVEYEIPMPLGDYRLEFLLSDPVASAPELFDILIDGVLVAGAIDLEAGGVNAAQSVVVPDFTTDPSSGSTLIEFVGAMGPARIAAISVSRIGDIFVEQPPQIVSTPPSSAAVGALLSYQPSVEDLNASDTTLFEILSGPGSIDSATGLVTYTPTAGEVGLQTIVFQVTDSSGLTDTQPIDLDVMFGSQIPEALFQIIGAGIEASTYVNNSFELTNLAAGGQRITSVTVDLSTTMLPDMVFDPTDGTPAGDTLSRCLVTSMNAAADLGFVEPADPCASPDPFSSAHQDGWFELTADFTNFDFGESFQFAVDVDPTSIQGSTTPAGSEPGGISGAELSGATVTVTFSDGQIATGQLFPNPSNDQGSSQALLKVTPLTAPTLSIVDATPIGGAPFEAMIGSVDQVAFINGPPDTPVTLLVIEGVLDVDGTPGGGFDVDPFEINNAIVIQQYDSLLNEFGNQTIIFKLGETITAQSLNSVYYVTAVTRDAEDSACTSPLAEPWILDIDPALGPPPEALVSIGFGGIDTSVFGFGQFQVFNDALGGQKIVGVTFDFSTSVIPDLVWDPDDGTPAGDLAASCLGAAFGQSETGWIPPIDPCVDPYSNPDDSGNGYFTVDLAFDNFDNNEAFWFSGDVDPSSVQGSTMSSAADPSGVSGVELTGTTVTVTFSDGTVTSGQTFQVRGSLGGTSIRTKVTPPAAPDIEVLDVLVDIVDGDDTFGFVPSTSITVRVTGNAGEDVSIIVMEGLLDPTDQPMGGFDIDPYEINDVSAILSATATIPMSGTIDVPFELPETTAGSFNNLSYICAVYRDPAVPQNTSLISNVYRVDVDPTVFSMPPAFTSTPPDRAFVGADLDYMAVAEDPEMDPVTYSFGTPPPGPNPASIDPTTGVVSWIPDMSNTGMVSFTIEALDSTMNAEMQTLELLVLDAIYRVNSGDGTGQGAPYVDSDGNAFEADGIYNVGGSTTDIAATNDILNSVEDPLYRSERSWASTDAPAATGYMFPVDPGTYIVRLHLAEIVTPPADPSPSAIMGAGERVFDVLLEGAVVDAGLDLYFEFGPLTATVLEYQIEVLDGDLDIQFGSVVGSPKVSAVEVLATSP